MTDSTSPGPQFHLEEAKNDRKIMSAMDKQLELRVAMVTAHLDKIRGETIDIMFAMAQEDEDQLTIDALLQLGLIQVRGENG